MEVLSFSGEIKPQNGTLGYKVGFYKVEPNLPRYQHFLMGVFGGLINVVYLSNSGFWL